MFKQIELTDIHEFERVQELHDEVCDLAGQPVQLYLFKEEPELERTEAAAATDLGYPEILFREGAEHCTNVCHELLHLRCAYLGYPLASVTYNAQEEDTQDGWDDYEAIKAINSMNEHRVIYPIMEQMGFDPIPAIEDSVRTVLFPEIAHFKEQLRIGSMHQRDLKFLAIRVAQLHLEVRDRELKDKLFIEKEWFPSHYAMGRKIAKRLRTAGTTPVAIKMAAKEALKIAKIPQWRYTFSKDRVVAAKDLEQVSVINP